MAPEIFDKREYDSKVDLWSMGCVLYEMLVGGPPFRGATPGELFSNIRDNKPLYIPSDVVISPDLLNLLKMVLLLVLHSFKYIIFLPIS
jgi:serine/threonine protein kinase